MKLLDKGVRMGNLKANHLSKYYPGCKALDDVTFSFDSGKVYALIQNSSKTRL
jgi:ABC-type multidrug transport system ATPase subunit